MSKPDRYPGFKSVRNLRDMGGYKGLDGRDVKWRTLFRSGNLAHLNEAEADQMTKWRVGHVLDFRSESEKKRDGTINCHAWKPRYLPIPIGGNAAAWLRELYDRLIHEEFPKGEMEKIFRKAYQDYPTVHAMDLGQFMLHLSEKRDDEAFLFNCTAGKDRTGIGAALLLSVLGVDRDQITEDYMLTNKYVDVAGRCARAAERFAEQYGRNVEPETLLPLFGVREEFLAATFDIMDAVAATPTDYLITHCGVAPGTISRLQSLYLGH